MAADYAVKQLAKMAGVSIRTLHLYDKMGLLKPLIRTASRYRIYGEKELLRLQQILFYKELDFPLKEIARILNDPDFELVTALESHKAGLLIRKDRINTLLHTITKTIKNLKNKTMENYEELYDGLPREQAVAYRNQAIEKWGEDVVERSEQALKEMSKLNLKQLKADQKAIMKALQSLAKERPEGDRVQEEIGRHYANIRGFWGVSDPTDLKAETYKGLAELYVTDERYLSQDGKQYPEFAGFMRRAMIHFAENKLK
jgi:DNA-binding transcriptional MerR regulator